MLLAVGILLLAPGKARDTAREITSGLMLYFQHHGDRLPAPEADWVALLVDGGYVPAHAFVSPFAVDESVISYFCVPAETPSFESDRVLLYEMPGLNPRGGLVFAFHDNHVEFVESAEAEAIIASLTLPDGTRWAPHLAPRGAP